MPLSVYEVLGRAPKPLSITKQIDEGEEAAAKALILNDLKLISIPGRRPSYVCTRWLPGNRGKQRENESGIWAFGERLTEIIVADGKKKASKLEFWYCRLCDEKEKISVYQVC